MATTQLQLLDEETWGERYRRARERSGVRLRDAAGQISALVPGGVSHTYLARLEDLPEPPAELKRRVVATLALVVYGYDPASFDLSMTDLPRAIDRKKLADLLIRQKACSALSAA